VGGTDSSQPGPLHIVAFVDGNLATRCYILQKAESESGRTNNREQLEYVHIKPGPKRAIERDMLQQSVKQGKDTI
jgi:hypothetical protein